MYVGAYCVVLTLHQGAWHPHTRTTRGGPCPAPSRGCDPQTLEEALLQVPPRLPNLSAQPLASGVPQGAPAIQLPSHTRYSMGFPPPLHISSQTHADACMAGVCVRGTPKT